MIVVAGHLCLDVIPQIPAGAALEPGKLVEVGNASFATGGAVANVGLALARLGLEPLLLGRVGDDPFGTILRDRLGATGGNVRIALETGVPAKGSTSYSIVINRPGEDRTFLHHPGCNDEFLASDLDSDLLAGAQLLYFGYPPLMQGIYRDGGEGLAKAFAELRRQGIAIALDMAMPDAGGPSGRVDWHGFLARVLPHVDLFLPSLDEVVQMLGAGDASAYAASDLSRLGDRLLQLGPAVVGLKLGDQGLYLRTAGEARLREAGSTALPPAWADRELHSPNFRVEVTGTTGAGDATISGLLAALTQRLPIEKAVSMASAVGACSVEGVDAVGGIRSWEETIRRISLGWERVLPRIMTESDWRFEPAFGLYLAPADQGGNE